MPAPAVTLDPGLGGPERWTLSALVSAAGARVVARGASVLELGADVARGLDRAFAHLARVEEAGAFEPDEHGRFPASASSLAPGDAPVDALVEPVRAALRAIGVEPQPAYPGGARFAVALTHDIDTPWRWSGRGVLGAGARLKSAVFEGRFVDARREAAGLALAPVHRLRGSDPNWSFARVAELERRHGWTSSSYVLAAHRDPHDGAAPAAYAARRPDLVRLLLEQGDEVGLHASYTAADDPAALAGERADLEALAGRRLRGLRFHYLRMRWPEVVRTLDDLGLAYDTSLGYAERPGPRAGFSFPFFPWDLAREQPARFVELPLVLMDATLDEERYLGLTPEEGCQAVDQVLDALAAVGGCAAVLWHNDRFDRVYGRGWDRVYAHLLDGIERRGGWAGPAAAIVDWWRAERCAS
jgi:peptidoglycan/xylan/chitin deacetylase (PgdA/CDA1 family)